MDDMAVADSSYERPSSIGQHPDSTYNRLQDYLTDTEATEAWRSWEPREHGERAWVLKESEDERYQTVSGHGGIDSIVPGRSGGTEGAPGDTEATSPPKIRPPDWNA